MNHYQVGMHQEDNKNVLKWHLHVVFLYYASYADRNNYKLLKMQNYRRFLIDSETVIDQSSFPPFDIAFRKIHTTSINQQQFQELIPNIAQLILPGKKRKEAFNIYISKHLQKLYQDIIHRSDFGSDVLIIEQMNVQQRSMELLDSIPIRKAYIKYIESTSMHQKNPEQTFEQVHQFLSDFEISPKLIYKAMVYLVFFYLLRRKEIQNRYTLDDFKMLLICIAQLYGKKIDDGENTQQGKVIRILQQMELSAGFKVMLEKNMKESAIMISFFKKNHLNRLVTEEQNPKDSVERQKNNESVEKYTPKTTKNRKNISFFTNRRSQRKQNLGTVRQLLDLQQGAHAQKLKTLFQKLCSHGQVANTKTLKSIKIQKYFHTLPIFSPLTQTWLDLKITDLCRSSTSGKIQFPQFLQLLTITAKQINITSEALYSYLIQNQETNQIAASNYSTTETKVQKKNHKQNEDKKSTLYIFYQVFKPLEKIFGHFSGGKKEMNFQNLSHLLYQFDVFPSFVTKSRLYKLFQKCSQSKSQLSNLIGQISLDVDGLIEILYLISIQIGQNFSKEEQALFLLERMQDSNGHRTILGTQGTNLIGDLRMKYSNIYSNALKPSTNDQKENFNELLESYKG